MKRCPFCNSWRLKVVKTKRVTERLPCPVCDSATQKHYESFGKGMVKCLGCETVVRSKYWPWKYVIDKHIWCKSCNAEIPCKEEK